MCRVVRGEARGRRRYSATDQFSIPIHMATPSARCAPAPRHRRGQCLFGRSGIAAASAGGSVTVSVVVFFIVLVTLTVILTVTVVYAAPVGPAELQLMGSGATVRFGAGASGEAELVHRPDGLHATTNLTVEGALYARVPDSPPATSSSIVDLGARIAQLEAAMSSPPPPTITPEFMMVWVRPLQVPFPGTSFPVSRRVVWREGQFDAVGYWLSRTFVWCVQAGGG